MYIFTCFSMSIPIKIYVPIIILATGKAAVSKLGKMILTKTGVHPQRKK